MCVAACARSAHPTTSRFRVVQHSNGERRMVEMGQSQTPLAGEAMSAVPPTTDIEGTRFDVGDVPLTTKVRRNKKTGLFDHLVGGCEDLIRRIQGKSPRSL